MQYNLRRVLVFFLILVLPAFIVKEYRVLKAARQSYISQPIVMEPQPACDHQFVITIITQNQADNAIRALTSIFSQEYQRYRIVLIDNGSEDHSFDKVQAFVMGKHARAKNVMVIRHTKPVLEQALYKDVLRECHDKEIVVLLEPNDWLANNAVLSVINQAYADSEVWLTYGAYLDYPSYRKNTPVKENTVSSLRRSKRAPWTQAGLRTFRAGLMKDVDLEEASASGIFSSMLALSKWHIRYIPETLYIHNRLHIDKAKSHLQLGVRLDQLTNTMSAQAMLAKAEAPEDTRSDMVIFSQNRPFQLNVSLESLFRYVRGLDQVHVIYTADEAHAFAYQDVMNRYQAVKFRIQDDADFKSYLASLLQKEGSHYVVLATDGILVKDPIHIQDCVSALEQTKAFAFFLDPSTLTINRLEDKDGSDKIHMVEMGANRLNAPYNMSLYRKADLAKELAALDFKNIQTLHASWSANAKTRQLGLYYSAAKVVNICRDHKQK